MGAVLRRLAGKTATAALAAALMALAGASQASGYISTTPNQHDFGAQQVGTVSAPMTFTLNVRCNNDSANPNLCLSNHPFTPNVTVTGDFAVQENGCTPPMPGDTVVGTFCTFKVAFRPLVIGLREGIADVGDPDGFGKAAARGTGLAVPVAPGAVKVRKKCLRKRGKKTSAAKKRKCRKKARRKK